MRPFTRGACDGLFAAVGLLMLVDCSLAWGYRPFASTDAAVVDPQEVELELGYMNVERADRENAVITPKMVLNYGVIRNLEVVGEFEVEKPPDADARLVNPGVFLKAVIKEGVLQNKGGCSVAVEAGPLLPSPEQGQRQVGFEGIGIVSGAMSPVTYHLNVGGGIDRDKAKPLVLWGVIVELPVGATLRLVGEINGESIRKKPLDASALIGAIWQSPWPDLLIDGGFRKGASSGAPDWRLTLGLTVKFSLQSAIGR